MTDEPVLWVNTPVRGAENIAEFLAVKRHLGINTSADVVRFLVHEKAREIGAVEDEEEGSEVVERA